MLDSSNGSAPNFFDEMHSKRLAPTLADPAYYDEDCVMEDMMNKGGQKSQQERFVIEVS
jgi:hypothetical protein